MRRPALLIAGMLLATGTGLALAAPASADTGSTGGDSSRWHCQWHNWNNWDNDWDNDWNNNWDHGHRWGIRLSDSDNRRRDCRHHRDHRRGHWGHHRGGHWTVATVSGGVLVNAGAH